MGEATSVEVLAPTQVKDLQAPFRADARVVWIRRGSNYAHACPSCTGQNHASRQRAPRPEPARLAQLYKRIPCRTCMPEGIKAAWKRLLTMAEARPNQIPEVRQ